MNDPKVEILVEVLLFYLFNNPSKEHYENGVSLRKQNLSLKYCQSLEQKLLTMGQDLCKEVLWVPVGQRATKLQAVKVGDFIHGHTNLCIKMII